MNKVLNKDIFRRGTFLTRYFCAAFPEELFLEKVIFQKSNVAHCLLFLDSYFFRTVTFLKDLTFHLSINPLSANPQNGQTQSNNSSRICRRIVWVCLTILWSWRLKGSIPGPKILHQSYFLRAALNSIIYRKMRKISSFGEFNIKYQFQY